MTEKNKICCFGELLLRFSPDIDGEWIGTNVMPAYIGGAELNVAQALAAWKVPVKYCTALPAHALSEQISASLQSKGIDVSAIHYSGNRIGTYYLPQGAELKNAGVIYDRAGSSFSSLQPGMINWEEVLNDCSWFHFTAISPALNETAVSVLKEALVVARAKGITISADLNYRAKLWQYGKSPVAVMPELIQYCDVLMGNLWAAEQLLGITSPIRESKGHTNGELTEAAAQSMLQIHQQYPAVQTIAYTFRLEDNYFAILQHGTEKVVSQEFSLTAIADKAGSGDCFMGGIIYGFYNHSLPVDTINFAAAAAVCKMQEKGDCTSRSATFIKSTMEKK